MCACARVTITSGALWMARIFFGEGFDEGLIFFFFYGISIDISVDGLFRAEKEEVWEGVHH